MVQVSQRLMFSSGFYIWSIVHILYVLFVCARYIDFRSNLSISQTLLCWVMNLRLLFNVNFIYLIFFYFFKEYSFFFFVHISFLSYLFHTKKGRSARENNEMRKSFLKIKALHWLVDFLTSTPTWFHKTDIIGLAEMYVSLSGPRNSSNFQIIQNDKIMGLFITIYLDFKTWT